MPRAVSSLQSRAINCFKRVGPENENSTKYLCEIVIDKEFGLLCNKKIDGKKKSNLTSHIQTVHPAYYDEYIVGQKFCHKEMALLRMKYIQNRAEIVGVNLRPFEILNDSGLCKISENDLKKLAEAGLADGLLEKNHKVYKSYISFAASKIHEKICLEVKNRLLSVMADISQKHHRSLLGIQIQFDYNGVSVKRSLGMIELREKHDAVNLKRIIFERLAMFEITENQIATITVDNGSNFIAMIKLMNQNYGNNDIDPPAQQIEQLNVDNIDRIDEIGTRSHEIFSDDEIQLLIMEAEAEIETEAEIDGISMIENDVDVYLDDTTEYDRLLEDLGNQFVLSTKFISGIRCGEHTLQLGVTDMLKSESIAVLMRLAKAAVIKLRTSSFRNKLILKNIKFTIPHMYCITRWGSEYDMV